MLKSNKRKPVSPKGKRKTKKRGDFFSNKKAYELEERKWKERRRNELRH